jgi:uncharacterized protein YdhG (YjbR/CyaY superfamily)
MPREKSSAVDAYIASYPNDVRSLLEELRQAIRDAAPQAEELMAYGIPTYKGNGTIVHFGGFRHHIGFYPTPPGIRAFAKELKPYKQSKGAVQFLLCDPLPLDLIKRIVEFRVHEDRARKKR